MPYNLDLEYRIELKILRLHGITKKKMFGGVCYLLDGNMCFGIYKDDLVLRVLPAKAEALLKKSGVKIFDITGKPMKGWVLVSPDLVETDDELERMLDLGINMARSLPKEA